MAKDKKYVTPKDNNNKKEIVLDTDAMELFVHVDVGHGDESMACLPWKGALKEP
jgi:hypothetical protein